jgi:hypothetical protein
MKDSDLLDQDADTAGGAERIDLEDLKAPACDPLPLGGVQGDRVGMDCLGARLDLPDEVTMLDTGAGRGGDDVLRQLLAHFGFEVVEELVRAGSQARRHV